MTATKLQTPHASHFETAYARLNEAQKKAVDTIYGPIMVIAGPGTGKTQIIASRTANLLKQSDINPENILITTFTEAGVISIKKRLSEFIGTESYKISVTTIHAFCNEIIQTFPEKFLEFKASRSIDDIEQIEILESILMDQKWEYLISAYDRFFYLPTIRDRIGKLKQEGITPEIFNEKIADQESAYREILSEIDQKLKKYEKTKEDQEKHINKLKELSAIYETYLAECRKKEVYDFADMINLVLKVMKKDKDLVQYYAERFQYIMVDEYQDTNNAQNQIIDAILEVGEEKNIMVVGDDDQSIYRFQGANLENMFHFSKKYPETKFIVLTENYRSTQEILDLATKSISKNQGRISNYIPHIQKSLHSNYTPTNKALNLSVPTNEWEEKGMVLGRINALISEGIDQEEIAVIVRTNKEVQEWSDFLQKNNISVESKLKSNILESERIKLILSLLEIVSDPYSNEEKLINIMRSDLSNINKVDVLRINKSLYGLNYTRKEKLKIFDLLINTDTLTTLALSDIESLLSFRDKVLDLYGKMGGMTFYSFFKSVIETFQISEYIENKGDFSDLQDLFTLFNLSKKWNEVSRNFSMNDFLRKIEYMKKYRIPVNRQVLKASDNGVQVLTAHQSKGLEYDTVFIPGLYHGNWSGKRVVNLLKLPFNLVGEGITESLSETEENEEEKRLFFVALTRAKRNLHLSFPMQSEEKQKIMTEFLQELDLAPMPIEISVNLWALILNELKPRALTGKISQEEELYIQEFLKNYKLSPSDLNKFIEDPKIFLRDAVFRYPFEDNEFTIFGKVYHKALELFYLEFKKSGTKPAKQFLEKTFLRHLSMEILTPEEEDRLREKGVSGLSAWYDSHINTLELPIELEYNFYPRNITLDGVPLTGKIDKIEPYMWQNDQVMLIDYKTGRIQTLNEIKGLTQSSEGRYFRQLLFYAILCGLDADFNKKYRVGGLGIDFVEGKDGEYKFVSVDYSDSDIERVKWEIIDAWKKINDMEFWREVMS